MTTSEIKQLPLFAAAVGEGSMAIAYVYDDLRRKAALIDGARR